MERTIRHSAGVFGSCSTSSLLVVAHSKYSRAFTTKETQKAIAAFSYFLYKFNVVGLISEKHSCLLPV